MVFSSDFLTILISAKFDDIDRNEQKPIHYETLMIKTGVATRLVALEVIFVIGC